MLATRDQNNHPNAILFAREDDGMIIGSANGGTAQFGIASEVRFFISQEHAVEYVKSRIISYLGRLDVDFLHQQASVETSPTLVPPRRM